MIRYPERDSLAYSKSEAPGVTTSDGFYTLIDFTFWIYIRTAFATGASPCVSFVIEKLRLE